MKPIARKAGNAIKKNIKDSGDSRITKIPASAGDISGRVDVANKPGYIHAISFNGTPYIVYNEMGDIPPGHFIMIGNTIAEPEKLRVTEIRNVFWQKLKPKLEKHGSEHSKGGNDPTPVFMSQFMHWLAEPSNTVGEEFTLSVFRGPFLDSSDIYHPPGFEYLDLTSHVPASGAIWVLVEILEDGTFNLVDGSPVGDRSLLTLADIPAKTANSRLNCAVTLYAGQTKISITRDWTDVFDLRFSDYGIVSGAGAGVWGSITGTLSDQTDLQTALDSKEDEANKTDVMAGNTASSTKYLSAKGVYDWVVSLGYQVALTATNFGDFLIGLAAKAVPDDADSILISSSTDSDDVKRTTLTQFKAFLKTYFDSLYRTLGGITTTAITTADLTASLVTGGTKTYILDISGMTADRNFILPAGTIGDIVEIIIGTGDDSFELILKGDTGVSIDGGSAATEKTRLFITNEIYTFKYTSANNWRTVYDGRIPCKVVFWRTGSNANTTHSAATDTKADWNTLAVDVGNMGDLTNDRAKIRRAGYYAFGGGYGSAAPIVDQKNFNILIYKNATSVSGGNASGGARLQSVANRQSAATSSSIAGVSLSFQEFLLAVDDYVEYYFKTEDANMGLIATDYAGGGFAILANVTFFSVTEILR